MESEIFISIVTPSFNRAYIIDETAQSILSQSDERWEWIIVDDGSTDDSWDKLQAYAASDSRIRVFQRERGPKGACTCRNIGVEKATGEHLIFLDTDDLLGPDAIANRLQIMDSLKTGVEPYFHTVTFENTPDKGFIWDDPHHPVSWLTGLFTMTPPCQGTAPLWNKAAFLKIGGWREDLKVWQDIELHIRAYFEGIRFEPVQKASPDIFLRLSPDSISHVNFHSPEKAKSRCQVVQYVLKKFDSSALAEEEIGAFGNMVISVFENVLGLRDFELARVMLSELNVSDLINDDQRAWMKKRLIHQRWRLYKIKALDKSLKQQQKRFFPFETNRKLCSQTWERNYE